MRIRIALALLSLSPLGGCSYTYDLKAVVVDGRLAFIVDPQSRSGASCVRSIEVTAVGSTRAIATPRDDQQAVASGTFWKQTTASDECLNPFPIVYGERLVGKPFVYEGRTMGAVEAKPLRVGEVYEVTTSGSGSGYGGTKFRLGPGGKIENLLRN